MEIEDAHEPPCDEGPAKRHYTTPTLVTYGDAVQLTQSGRGSRNDGARFGRSRTN